MPEAAAIVLAGGRSSRMGSDKATLAWHGSTLVQHVSGILAATVDGPVIVVAAHGQALPPLPRAIEVVEDERPERGPLEGIGAGLRTLGARAPVAFVSATDVPLLHPALVRAVLRALGPDEQIAVPVLDGRPQPLAAAYRGSVLETVDRLLAANRLRVRELLDRCQTRWLTAPELLTDEALMRNDPELHSLQNVNTPAEYERLLALPADTVSY